MKLIDLEKRLEFKAEILKVETKDYLLIDKSGQFEFDWTKEKENHVFKILKKDDDEILGLLSIINYPEEWRVHINLLENSNQNKGKDKKVDKIAGCLLAFAARLAFEKGYLGFLSLVPKTELIGLYVKKYGFSLFGNQLAIEKQASIDLIEKYL
jgi:hypothetical protein